MDTCKQLNLNSSPGFDGIKLSMIKCVIDHIVIPLNYIFNLSLTTGIFPSQLKIAKVVPIFKSGDSNCIKNYRPISVLPAFSKFLERIIHKRLYDFISQHNLLHHRQYGFRKNYSSYMAVLDAYNEIAARLDKKHHTMGIFLDLSKAFDTINHSILLDKLLHYGVRGTAFEWFKSYLTNRSQYVSYNGYKSDMNNITCGVPQGSILGPLLFIIYLNDIVYSSDRFSFFIFADDTNTVISDQKLDQLLKKVNDELVKISLWFKCNKLSLNITKTNFVMFRNKYSNRNYHDLCIKIDEIPISQVEHTKFLGVYIDQCLDWRYHTKYVTNIISKYIGILYRLKHCLPRDTLFSLYKTLVLPYIQYCNIVWADSNNCRLQSIHIKQKKIIRLCTNAAWLAHSPPLFRKLTTLTVYDIHKLQKVSFIYRFFNNNLPSNYNNFFVKNNTLHGYGTRVSHLLRPSIFNTDLARHTIKTQGPHLWNSLTDNIIKSNSLNILKKRYTQYLVSLYQ